LTEFVGKGTEIGEEGLLEDEPNEDSGIVDCDWGEGGVMVIGLRTDIDAFEEVFEVMVERYPQLMEEEGISYFQGEQGEFVLRGNTVQHQLFECEKDGDHTYGVMACTYFDELERGFIFVYIGHDEDPLSKLQKILGTFQAD
jgi:hypothetical protein